MYDSNQESVDTTRLISHHNRRETVENHRAVYSHRFRLLPPIVAAWTGSVVGPKRLGTWRGALDPSEVRALLATSLPESVLIGTSWQYCSLNDLISWSLKSVLLFWRRPASHRGHAGLPPPVQGLPHALRSTPGYDPAPLRGLTAAESVTLGPWAAKRLGRVTAPLRSRAHGICA